MSREPEQPSPFVTHQELHDGPLAKIDQRLRRLEIWVAVTLAVSGLGLGLKFSPMDGAAETALHVLRGPFG